VNGSVPSKTEEKPTGKVSISEAGDVGAPATLDSFAPTVGTTKDGKRLMVVHLDQLAAYQGAARDERI
jgi:hypothetical protein